MRRVLLTADAVGGVWTAALDLAAGLAAAGDEVALAVAGPAPAADQAAAARALGVALRRTPGALDWLGEARDIEAAAIGFAAHAAQFGADVVHLHAPAYAALARYCAPVTVSVHSCVASWRRAVHGGPLPADLAWRAALTAEGLAAADAVIAPSRSFAAALRALYPEAAGVIAISNGRAWTAGPARGPAAAFALAAGRFWDPAKNAAALDRAANGLSAPLLLAGPLVGPTGQSFTPQSARALGRITAQGIRALLAQRPVFVSAALYEPFGLAALEAAQAGAALVLSDIPTHRELWEGAALFAPAADEAALAAQIERCLTDAPLRRRLGLAARRRARRFGLGAFVRRVRAIHAGTAAALAPEGAL